LLFRSHERKNFFRFVYYSRQKSSKDFCRKQLSDWFRGSCLTFAA
jgi:hypothetical protein